MKLKTTLLAVLFAGFAFGQIQFPQVSSQAEIEQKIGFTEVEVKYYRPNLNNRTAFGGIVPYGQVWRTGANNNTVIEFDTDVLVEGKALVKGKYSLYSVPNPKSWDVIFYKSTENWGNPEKWDESQIALKVSVPSYTLADKVESFTIGFEDVTVHNAKLALSWENTKVNVKLDVPTHQKVLQNIQTQLNANSSARDYYGAANYYFNNKVDLKKAQEWINIAVSKDPNSKYFKDLKAKIDAAVK